MPFNDGGGWHRDGNLAELLYVTYSTVFVSMGLVRADSHHILAGVPFFHYSQPPERERVAAYGKMQVATNPARRESGEDEFFICAVN